MGSINHIIDIDGIVSLIYEVYKQRDVELHVIGGGISCTELLSRVRQLGVRVIWHGMLFDEAERRKMLSKCHFGLNMMKTSVFVGLTTKSIDYASCGLPWLNSIPGDSEKLVGKYKAGINLLRISPEEAAQMICEIDEEKHSAMRRGTVMMFQENFSKESVENKISTVLGSAGL